LKGDLSKEIANMPQVNEFVVKYSTDAAAWDSKKILKRADDMASEAYQKVWKIT